MPGFTDHGTLYNHLPNSHISLPRRRDSSGFTEKGTQKQQELSNFVHSYSAKNWVPALAPEAVCLISVLTVLECTKRIGKGNISISDSWLQVFTLEDKKCVLSYL